MKKVLLLFSALFLTLSALAYTPGDRTGLYLRGYGVSANDYDWDNCKSEFEFKYGDEAGSWIYLILPNDGITVNAQEWAIGPKGWAQDKTIIAANPNGGRWADDAYINECYYGGARNGKYPESTVVKAIKVVLPTEKTTFDFNNGKNPTLPENFVGSGMTYVFGYVPKELSEIGNGGSEDPKPADKQFYLRATLLKQWEKFSYPMKNNDDGTWSIQVNIDTTGKSGEDLEFAIGGATDNGWASDETIVAGNNRQTSLGDNECFFGGGRNASFPANCIITKVTIKQLPTNIDDYASSTYVPATGAGIITIEGYRASTQSDYMLQVWSMEDVGEENPWNSAGGLYKPFRNDEDRFEIDPKYIRTISFHYETLKYLCFNGPLTDEEIASFGTYKYTNGEGFEKFKDVLGLGENAPENESEIYVIDFTTVNSEGLYLISPNRSEMTMNTFENLDAFYRSGVRFGFFDNSYPLQDFDNGDEKALLNNYLRYQKWGHVFRLNEVARPVNAFPRYDTDGNIAGFDDSFGPAQWNGIPAETWNGSNQQGNDYVSTADNYYLNKMGDCRILEEHNFWLKQIFLEVATDDQGKKHFYMSFNGTPDLLTGFDSQNVEYYIPADQDVDSHRNFVHGQPNIFPGVNIQTNEMGYQRYFNLDPENWETMVGTTKENANFESVHSKFLYNLDLEEGYSVKTDYKVNDANGATVTINGEELAGSIEYQARGGKFYQKDENGEYNTLLSTIAGDSEELGDLGITNQALKVFVEPKKYELLFDPEDENRPVELVVESTYIFPKSSKPEGQTFSNSYPIDITHTPESNEIPVTVTAGEFSYMNFYNSNVSWEDFTTIQGSKGHYPVVGYTVTALGTDPVGDFHEELDFANGSVVENLEWIENGNLTVDNHRYNYVAPAVNALDDSQPLYQMHYKVESAYNYAYVQGVAEAKDLTDEAYANTDADADGYVTLENGVKYQIRPEAISGEGHVTFDVSTGVDEITVDNDAEAVYYNLQGVQVTEPANGIFIKVVGDKATKVIL